MRAGRYTRLARCNHALVFAVSVVVTTRATFPSDGVLRRRPHSTTIPSDFRCTAVVLAVSLVESRCPDGVCADEAPVLRASPWTRAALPIPRDPAPVVSDRPGAVVAFAVT